MWIRRLFAEPRLSLGGGVGFGAECLPNLASQPHRSCDNECLRPRFRRHRVPRMVRGPVGAPREVAAVSAAEWNAAPSVEKKKSDMHFREHIISSLRLWFMKCRHANHPPSHAQAKPLKSK